MYKTWILKFANLKLLIYKKFLLNFDIKKYRWIQEILLGEKGGKRILGHTQN